MPALRIYMQQHPDRPGSICCLARDPAQPRDLYLVSAAHVLAPLEIPDVAAVRRMRIGIACELPGGPRQVATLFDWQQLSFGAMNPFDVGVAEVHPDAAQALLEHVPLPTGVTNLAEENWDVCMQGARSQLVSRGRIRERQVADLFLSYVFPGNIFRASFAPEKHFSTDPVSVEGDSGAAAFDPQGRLAGLLVGGRNSGDKRSFFARIGPVLQRFALEPVLHADHPGGVNARSLWASAQPMAAAVEPVPESPGASPERADPRVDVLARTLWGEARGEARAGMEAVACVVLNRAKRGPRYWWGGTIVDVCKRPYQFSCWNANDPNRARLLAVTADDAVFRVCLEVAQAAVGGTLVDTTSNATHYHVESMLPGWARGKSACAHIGRHLFYNNIE